MNLNRIFWLSLRMALKANRHSRRARTSDRRKQDVILPAIGSVVMRWEYYVSNFGFWRSNSSERVWIYRYLHAKAKPYFGFMACFQCVKGHRGRFAQMLTVPTWSKNPSCNDIRNLKLLLCASVWGCWLRVKPRQTLLNSCRHGWLY